MTGVSWSLVSYRAAVRAAVSSAHRLVVTRAEHEDRDTAAGQQQPGGVTGRHEPGA